MAYRVINGKLTKVRSNGSWTRGKDTEAPVAVKYRPFHEQLEAQAKRNIRNSPRVHRGHRAPRAARRTTYTEELEP